MARYQITRAYPDGVDEDYRIDAFDIAGLGYVTIDQALMYWDIGHRYFTRAGLVEAQVDVRSHWQYPYRRYLTTLPDGYKPNNLSSLAHPTNRSALSAYLR